MFCDPSFHEPRSADIPVCGLAGHSCPVLAAPSFGQATGKSPEPADKNVCATSRFMAPTHVNVMAVLPSYDSRRAQDQGGLRIPRSRLKIFDPDSHPPLVAHAWRVVLLLWPVAVLNYLDRQM